jgi:S-DNA-T family DNA segregation ATPase FtsK/SpoIIIE
MSYLVEMATKNKISGTRSTWREVVGILIATFGLLLFLGTLSYDPSEIGFFRNQTLAYNWIGPLGAYTAFVIFFYFGVAGYILPLCVMWIGISSVFWSASKIYPRVLWFFLALFSLAGLADMNEQLWHGVVDYLNIGSPGGLMGEVLAQRTIGYWIGHAGAGLLFFVLLLISISRMLDVHLIELVKTIWQRILDRIEQAKESKSQDAVAETVVVAEARPRRKRGRKGDVDPVVGAETPVDIRAMVEAQQQTAVERVTESKPNTEEQPARRKRTTKPAEPTQQEVDAFVSREGESVAERTYQLPSLDLLDAAVIQGKGMSADQVADTARILQEALEEFGVEAKVTGVQQGPVVTCYEILPSAGVRVERIKALSDNIALKMHAESIRIQAPIPGKGVCGVEVPNSSRAGVFFRDLVESSEFQSDTYALPLVLGKDVSGDSMIFDLAKMPHMLIAGATGAGKSVCMNTILTGLLMKYSPEDLRMILVDPKTVEFHTYNNLPHLVVPVITDAKKVALGLRWAIDEMERRFRYFRQAGVRDLPGYNQRPITKQDDLFEGDAVAEAEAKGEEIIPDRLPYIVIVIDELADLMAVAQAEIEAGIARLAAKSRAAGIHMILATQRPDVKVITGTIKANFPARVAFKVSQKVDSRTILDRMGADTLLGKGDMLVLPPGSDKLIRSQGAFTSDGEIERVATFWKEQSKPEFIADIQKKMEKPAAELPEMDDGGDDEILEQALEVIRQTKRASTSSLQRRLRIGYTRAARIMDLLEERGVIGPPDGAGPRTILIDLDGEIPQHPGEEDGTDAT